MKTIFTALAPNVEKDDAKLALKLLFSPWRWKRGTYKRKLENSFKNLARVKHVFFFESGRTGLYALLKCIGISFGDEVLLQAYTCVAVPNSIIWTGGVPVYIDCLDNYTMSPSDFEQKITPKSKAVIVQHTFGISADTEAIMRIARKNNILVIEDCAHSLGLVKTRADASFYSFGRDKVISSTFGGAVALNDDTVAERLETLRLAFMFPMMVWIFQQLWYPIIMQIVRSSYDLGFGRLLLYVVRTLGWISRPLTLEERAGIRPKFLARRFPEALARLALNQLEKLTKFNAHRARMAAIYKEFFPGGIGILRFTINTPRAEEIRKAAKKEKIFLGNWYDAPIAPRDVSYQAVGYKPGSCPNAEKLARGSLNLPTDIHITENDARRIAKFIQNLQP